MLNTKCQLCSSSNLKLALDLGYHPLADSFLKPEQLNEMEKHYPLRLLLCEDCGYVTSQYIVPPEIRYQETDYSYTSSNSKLALSHFEEMAKEIINRANVTQEDLVVDIGSNVGTLLQAFQTQIKCQIIGVEPAPNIAKIAKKDNTPTIEDFFSQNSVQQILKTKKAKVITATNAFNHITNLNEFMENICTLLTDDGMFVFETPYLLDLVEMNAFDTIYLEHISYFGVKPLRTFFKKFGLFISYIERNTYMGGSMRVYVKKNPDDENLAKKYILAEEEAKIYNLETYNDLMSKIHQFKFNLCQQIFEIKSKGQKIIAVGAAAKGNTLLNYCKLDQTLIDFITDSSPLKIGKYTPGSHIPIKSDADITPDIDFALILPWNIADFLKEKLKYLNLKFIIPKMKK